MREGGGVSILDYPCVFATLFFGVFSSVSENMDGSAWGSYFCYAPPKQKTKTKQKVRHGIVF